MSKHAGPRWSGCRCRRCESTREGAPLYGAQILWQWPELLQHGRSRQSLEIRVRCHAIIFCNCKLTEYDVGILDFFLDDIGGVQVTENNPDVRVLACELGSLVLAADQSRQLPVGMGVGNDEKAITANVPCNTSPTETIRSFARLTKWVDLHEDLGRSHVAVGYDGDMYEMKRGKWGSAGVKQRSRSQRSGTF